MSLDITDEVSLNMKFHIMHLGPVADAQIDLSKNLTVFCGPNNTGKTYVSYIIHALYSQTVFAELPENLVRLDPLLEGRFFLCFDERSLMNCRQALSENLTDQLSSIFGISGPKLNTYFSKFEAKFEGDGKAFLKKVLEDTYSFKIQQMGCSFLVEKKAGSLEVCVEILGKGSFNPEDKTPHTYFLFCSILKTLVLSQVTDSAIFPVERNSIYTFSKELSISRNILIDQMQELNSSGNRLPMDLFIRSSTRYPKAIRDGLMVANDLAEIQKHSSEFVEFANAIEKGLLLGQVNVGKEGEVYFQPTKAKSTRIPIHLTASIVKTLTSLVIYLRHLAKSNDLIIIDEPELNLHPDSQILLTRILVQLVNRGFKVLISTHSDYVVRELNNLIMLSSPKIKNNEQVEELKAYSFNEHIDPKNVGVYLFNFKNTNSKKVKVKSVPVTETGFDIETIDNVISSLSDTSESLYEFITYV